MKQSPQQTLKRELKNRHIQLIALGTAVGTGLFLGITQTIQMAGPSVILGYGIGGFIAFLIMRQLGEMIVEEPVAGNFSHFAYHYWNNFAGFCSGWNAWLLYILVSMAELTAVGLYVQTWWPEIPTWVSAGIFFVLINLVNLSNVKVYGEIEFWFSMIKIIAVMGMIVFGSWLLFGGHGGSESSINNLWQHGGFFPHGISGLVMSLAVIMFSFGGLELVGITAAEAADPQKSIPRAVNQVVYRILVFYIGSLTVLLALYPWTKIVAGQSPFFLIFHELGDSLVANALNVVILTAALSVYNSCVYSNSRMLYALALQGNAPQRFTTVDERGVPYLALGFSALVTVIVVLINYLMPAKAFGLLMSLVVSALIINWSMISLTHHKFRKAKRSEGISPRFPALFYPYGNLISLGFMALVLVIMLLTPGMAISVLLIPVWLAVLALGFRLKNIKSFRQQNASH